MSAQPEVPEKKPIVCYNCREVGHKAPACPKPHSDKARKKEVKLLSMPTPKVKELQENEILIKVEGRQAVTLDSGATITVLPKESIPSEWLTGKNIEGKGFSTDHSLNIEEANLSFLVDGTEMTTLGGVVPSNDINGIGVLSYRSVGKTGKISFPKLLEDALQRTDDDRLYLEYEDSQKEIQGVVQDSLKGDEVDKVEEDDMESLGLREAGFLAKEEGSKEEELAKEDVQSLVDDEILLSEMINNKTGHENHTDEIDTSEIPGDLKASEKSMSETSGGNDVSDNEISTLEITTPKYSEDNAKLREESLTDEGLKTMRELANNNQQGYSWKSGLIIRERLDDLGRVKTQICIPTSQRQKLMTLAHEKFGHLSRNLVVQHITKSFYWPTLWKDVRVHVQSCDVCQRVTKKNPKKAPMVK